MVDGDGITDNKNGLLSWYIVPITIYAIGYLSGDTVHFLVDKKPSIMAN